VDENGGHLSFKSDFSLYEGVSMPQQDLAGQWLSASHCLAVFLIALHFLCDFCGKNWANPNIYFPGNLQAASACILMEIDKAEGQGRGGTVQREGIEMTLDTESVRCCLAAGTKCVSGISRKVLL
jgi:hypothetical protein